ncbi:porin [Zhongshania sp.]|jgi:predicted porin|uniref:porin n=1 Tax=Zhongshania sp. TaxID=1971902 RepID=UPI002A82B0DB|nr:porin [Zhongshania sp.]
MKRLLLPASILLASGAQLAHADLSFYGKANVSYQQTDLESKDTEQWELNSNASRIGLKGSTPIDNTALTVIYQAEYEIAVDTGTADSKSGNTFKQRNTFVGIQGDFGTLSAGQFDTATKLLGKEVDQFNDLVIGDIKNIMEGENRQKNIVQYASPTVLGGLSFTAAVSPGENRDANEDNAADGNVFSVQYQTKQFLFAIAHDTDIDDYDTTRAIFTTRLGPVDLGVLVQTAELAGEVDSQQEDSALISAAFNATDKWVLKAQYGVGETELVTGDQEKTQAALGADYKLSSALTVFAYAAQVENDTVGAISTTDSTAGAGIWFKF